MSKKLKLFMSLVLAMTMMFGSTLCFAAENDAENINQESAKEVSENETIINYGSDKNVSVVIPNEFVGEITDMEIDNLLESEQVADGDVINIIDVGYNNDNVLQTYRGTEVRTELTWGRCTGTALVPTKYLLYSIDHVVS